jgi:hypothetical protein
MTTALRSFENDTSGSLPSDFWTNTGYDFWVENSPLDGTPVLRSSIDTSSSDKYCVWSGGPSFQDGEVLVKFRAQDTSATPTISSSNNVTPALIRSVAQPGVNDTASQAVAVAVPSLTSESINRVDGYYGWDLVTTPARLINTWYYARLRAISDTLFASKLWKFGDSEPSTWDISRTSGPIGTFNIAAGYVGVHGYHIANITEWAWISVGYNGESAINPDDSTGTTLPATPESDSVNAPVASLSYAGVRVTETDLSVTPELALSFAAQPVSESSQAISPLTAVAYAGQPISEVDAVQISVSALVVVPAALAETDSAIDGQSALSYGGQPTTETDQDVVFQSGSSVSPAPVAETDQVLAPVCTLSAVLGPITEAESTPAAIFAKRFIGAIAVELDAAIIPILSGSQALSPLIEVDAAIPPETRRAFIGAAITESGVAKSPITALTVRPVPVHSLNIPVVGDYSFRAVIGAVFEMDRLVAPILGNQFIFQPELISISSATPRYSVSSKTPVFTISKS